MTINEMLKAIKNNLEATERNLKLMQKADRISQDEIDHCIQSIEESEKEGEQ